MTVLWLVMGILIGSPFQDPPPDNNVGILIKNLSAPRQAERTSAANTLVAMGEVVRPALVRLTESTDLDLRRIAANILDRIEGKKLNQPKTVVLDFHDRSLSEIADVISERAQEGLVLQTGTDLKRGDQRITLVSEGQISFWDAVERLEKAANLQIDLTASNNINRNAMVFGNPNVNRRTKPSISAREVALLPRFTNISPPRFRSGRFEVFVSNVHVQRDRILGTMDGREPYGSVDSRFEVKLQVLPEPSLTVGKFGEVFQLQALDDRGQSLIADSVKATRNDVSAFGMANLYPKGQMGGSNPLVIRLKYPEQPSQFIRLLKGEMEITVIGSKLEGIVGSLISSLGTPVHQNEMSLTIHEVKKSGMTTINLIDMTLIRAEPTVQLNNGMGTMYRTANIAPPGIQGWLLFLDAKGRCVDRIAANTYNVADGQRRTIQYNQPAGAAPATAVQYLPPTWTTLQVPFEFRDIPMP